MATAEPAQGTEVVADAPGRVAHAPSDVLRLAVATLSLLALTVVGVLGGDGLVAFISDVLSGLHRLPSGLVTTIAALAQVGAAVLLVLPVALAVRTRSPRLLGTAIGAAIVGGGLAALVTALVDVQATAVTEVSAVGAAGREGAAPAVALAVLAALISAVGPWTTRTWRRIGWGGVVLGALTLFFSGPIALDAVFGVLAGWTAGTAAVVLAGSPSHRPTGASIAAGLAAVGVPLARLEQVSLDARGSTPYFGETTDGQRLFVKALGADERSADLLFRAYRRVQPRDLGDERAFSSLRRAVEHEALVALAARDLGVRTPRMVAFAAAEPHGYALAYEAIEGRSLDRVEPDEVTDAVLDGLWEQLALLRRHRVAHRDLRLANVFMAHDRQLWIIDFGFSELAASDVLLATDLAELLASSATVVGPERSVAAAVRAIGDEVATAHPRLELPMLSGATRTALRADPATLEVLRQQVAARRPATP